MNEKEKALYLSIKSNPKNPLFQFLYHFDESGNIIPRVNRSLKLLPNGIPMILEEENNYNPLNLAHSQHSTHPLTQIKAQTTFNNTDLPNKNSREIITGEIPKL